MNPDDFAALSRARMMVELKRLGIAKGKSRTRKKELAGFYRRWHDESRGAGLGKPEHVPQTFTLSPDISIETLPPHERREVEAADAEERVPQTFTLSPDISVETLPPAERVQVERVAEQEEQGD